MDCAEIAQGEKISERIGPSHIASKRSKTENFSDFSRWERDGAWEPSAARHIHQAGLEGGGYADALEILCKETNQTVFLALGNFDGDFGSGLGIAFVRWNWSDAKTCSDAEYQPAGDASIWNVGMEIPPMRMNRLCW